MERDSAQRRTYEAAELIEAMEAPSASEASTEGGDQSTTQKTIGLEKTKLENRCNTLRQTFEDAKKDHDEKFTDIVERMTALYCTDDATELTGSHLELKTDIEQAKGLAINMITACESQLKELLKKVREATTHNQLKNIAASVKDLGKKLGDNMEANRQFIGKVGSTRRHLQKEERKK